MICIRRFVFSLFFLVVLGISSPLLAYEGPIQFQIAEIFVSNPDDMYYRVISADDSNWHCDGGPKEPGWSFVDYYDPAAKGKVSTLLSAYLTQKTVNIMTQQVTKTGLDGIPATYCQIMQVSVR